MIRHSSDGVAIDLVAIGILRRGDSMVLVQQANDQGRYWVLPGGLVEAGELISDALVREIREEASATVHSIGTLACTTQIDRVEEKVHAIFFIFEIADWEGSLGSADPDDEILAVDLVPEAEAIERLASNGGWRGVRDPLIAYLRGEVQAGAIWCYREIEGEQHLVTRVPGAGNRG